MTITYITTTATKNFAGGTVSLVSGASMTAGDVYVVVYSGEASRPTRLYVELSASGSYGPYTLETAYASSPVSFADVTNSGNCTASIHAVMVPYTATGNLEMWVSGTQSFAAVVYKIDNLGSAASYTATGTASGGYSSLSAGNAAAAVLHYAVASSTITSISVPVYRVAGATGTLYLRVRQGEALVGTLGSVDVSTFATTPGSTVATFTGSVTIPHSGSTLLSLEYSGSGSVYYANCTSASTQACPAISSSIPTWTIYPASIPVYLYNIAGLSTYTMRGSSSTATGSGTDISSGATGTLGTDSEVGVGCLGVESWPSETVTWTTGSSNVSGNEYNDGTTGDGAASNITVYGAVEELTATTAQTAAGTHSYGRDWAAAIVTFLTAAGEPEPSVSDTINVTESVSTTVSTPQVSVNDIIVAQENVNANLPVADVDLSASDEISITEATALFMLAAISVSDSVEVAEFIALLLSAAQAQASDTITVNESVVTQVQTDAVALDSVELAEFVLAQIPIEVAASDTINLNENVDATASAPEISVNDTVSVSDAAASATSFDLTVSDTVTADEASTLTTSDPQVVASDTVGVDEAIEASFVLSLTVDDTITVAEDATVELGEAGLLEIGVSDTVNTAEQTDVAWWLLIDHETGDFSQYESVVGDFPSVFAVKEDAAIVDSYGAWVNITTEQSRYARQYFPQPSEALRFRFHFRYKQDELYLYDSWTFLQATTSSSAYLFMLRFENEATNDLVTRAYKDNYSFIENSVTIESNRDYCAEVLVVRETTSSSNDGYLTLFLDGVEQFTLSGVDNYSIFGGTEKFRIGLASFSSIIGWYEIHFDDIVVRSGANTITQPIGCALVNVRPSISEGISVSESAHVTVSTLQVVASDTITISESVSAVLASEILVSDTIGVTESATSTVNIGVYASDAIDVSENSVAFVGTLQVYASDVVSVAENTNIELGDLGYLQVSALDTLVVLENATLSTSAPRALASDTVNVSENADVNISVAISVSDSITVAESVSAAIEATQVYASDTVSVAENVSLAASDPQVSTSDTVSTAEGVSVDIQIGVSTSDSVVATEDASLSVRAPWYNPDVLSITVGSVVAGTIEDTWTENDTRLQLAETTSTPGYDYSFLFYDVKSTIASVDINGYYSGNPAHNVKIYQWNFTTEGWDALTGNANDFPSSGSDQDYEFAISGDADHLSSGELRLRIAHTSAGNPIHNLYLDWMQLTTHPVLSESDSVNVAESVSLAVSNAQIVASDSVSITENADALAAEPDLSVNITPANLGVWVQGVKVVG